ncbi:M14 family zinc carboxypeptidase [Crocinitomix catalasitica]|uniref:M14 family zinc carboxypeptidase n=1 Tax=Crocinitomix catalasitica TaxID=184607 RepID=UPI000687EA62|nr:M14 family zinc carboxypeptidase [Crocinitomix catalasitica]
MKYLLSLFIFIAFNGITQTHTNYKENKTYTYEETASIYTNFANQSPEYCKLINAGPSDYGKDIQLFLLNRAGNFTPKYITNQNVILINNAIHPGEPCGVDACIKLIEELLAHPKSIPSNLTLAIIPMYNVGGAHNRGCCSRANQNGPNEYGFRGNAQNLDLNRDFIKADSKNTKTFYRIFHSLAPAVFIDTHTSNGADYQYIMTLITSQKDKMNPHISDLTMNSLNPYLYKKMELAGYPMTPYVNTIKSIPDEGLVGFLETPRYSTGYTNLFNTISYVTEAHMLKPYHKRVESTYQFIKIMLDYMSNNEKLLKDTKIKANNSIKNQKVFPLNWTLDQTKSDSILFAGYKAIYKKSEVTHLDRLFYDQNQPFKKYIRFCNEYNSSHQIEKSNYYIIPQAYSKIVQLLQANNVNVYQLTEDVLLNVSVAYIKTFETVSFPYEGHYLHYNQTVRNSSKSKTYIKGDYVIPLTDNKSRFIIETLEPQAVDSYFSWNYFDGVLQRKEGFSAYVFEDEAETMLIENPALLDSLNEKRKNDEAFAQNSHAQLYYLYTQSEHFEPTINQYPITRTNDLINPQNLIQLPPLSSVY